MDWVCSGLAADWSAIANVATAVIALAAYRFARGEIKRRKEIERFLRSRDAAEALLDAGHLVLDSKVRVLAARPDRIRPEDHLENIADYKNAILRWSNYAQRLGAYFDDRSPEAYEVARIAQVFVDGAEEANETRVCSKLAAELRLALGPFIRGPSKEEELMIKNSGVEWYRYREKKHLEAEADRTK
jgi:hypothetical protein